MPKALYVFKHNSSDLATATPDRSGKALLACPHASNPSDWSYLDAIDEDDLPNMVMNARELAKALADNNFFHLDKNKRLQHPFFDRHQLAYMGSQV